MFRDPAAGDGYEGVCFFSSFVFDPLVVAFVFIVDETTVLLKCANGWGRTRSASFFTAISEFVVCKLSVGVRKLILSPKLTPTHLSVAKALNLKCRKKDGVIGLYPAKR